MKEALEPRKPNSTHQADADRRDQLQAISTNWKPQILKRDSSTSSSRPKSERRTWKKEQDKQYEKMHAELKGSSHAYKPSSSSRRAKRELESERESTIDICSISTAAF
ncbi:MAG: hypothetical protein M1813_000396 [Trichoglossum hirsutum]|nr:MAG: hypothetical protein M1813_000396 [Trichoglossum hirsutum]